MLLPLIYEDMYALSQSSKSKIKCGFASITSKRGFRFFSNCLEFIAEAHLSGFELNDVDYDFCPIFLQQVKKTMTKLEPRVNHCLTCKR